MSGSAEGDVDELCRGAASRSTSAGLPRPWPLQRPQQLPRPTSAVALARPSSPTWHSPRAAPAASFFVVLRKKASKEQATARSLDSFSLLMDETTGGSARSSSQSPPATDAGVGRRAQPVGGDGPCGRPFSPLYFFLLSFLFLAPAFMRIASTISSIPSATCSPSAVLLLPAVKNANLCIEWTLQLQPHSTRALLGKMTTLRKLPHTASPMRTLRSSLVSAPTTALLKYLRSRLPSDKEGSGSTSTPIKDDDIVAASQSSSSSEELDLSDLEMTSVPASA